MAATKRELLRQMLSENGRKGAKARWAKVSKAERSAIARKTVKARWARPRP